MKKKNEKRSTKPAKKIRPGRPVQDSPESIGEKGLDPELGRSENVSGSAESALENLPNVTAISEEAQAGGKGKTSGETIETPGEPYITQDEVEDEYLSFVVSGEEYAVDIMNIREIIRVVQITYVPRAPSYITGIISIRGTIVPIFDLSKRLGIKPTPKGKQSRIIAVSLGIKIAGFSVDAVTEVVRLKKSDIEPPPPTLKEGKADCIKGVGRFRNRMIILMDVEKTLNLGELSDSVGQAEAKVGHS
jgi:purine-binding chemotaxis protein CheW